MALKHKPNVQEVATNNPDAVTGFGLNAAAIQPDGLRNVLSTYVDTDQLPYFASDNAGLWEEGEGTVSGSTLVRTTITASSNAGVAVDFSVGGDVVIHVEFISDTSNRLIKANTVIIRNDGVLNLAVPAFVLTNIGPWLTTVDRDIDTVWDTVNNKFVINRSGVYRLSAAIRLSGLQATKRGIMTCSFVSSIAKNKTIVEPSINDGSICYFDFSIEEQFNKNDEISLGIFVLEVSGGVINADQGAGVVLTFVGEL